MIIDIIDENQSFLIKTIDDKLEISLLKNSEILKSFKFNSLTTLDVKHSLPFDLTLISDDEISVERELILAPVENITNSFFRSNLVIQALGKESDQLSISLTHPNPDISESYLNALTNAFDNDGITDRKLEYNNTISFVNQEVILKQDLEIIELRKQSYKQENNLSDISVDANNKIDLKYTYNSEIFQLESQKQITEYLIEFTANVEYGYLPINIGLENFDLNNMINDSIVLCQTGIVI